MTLDEVRTDKRGWCLLIISGLPPFHSRKYDLVQHPNYRLTADADPVNRWDESLRKEYDTQNFFANVRSVTTISELNAL